MPNRHSTLTSLFSDVADAIRSKTGGTAELVADNFDTAIEGIQTQKPEQSKTATPSTSQQTVEPDEGYALSSVVVNAMPTGNVGTATATKGTVSSNSISVTPQVAAGTAGYNAHSAYSGTAVTVSASELVSGNIELQTASSTNVTNYATATVRPGTLSAGATTINLTGQNVTLSDSYNGIPLYASGYGTVSVPSGGYLETGTSQQSTSAQQTKYLVGVDVPVDTVFLATNKGQMEIANWDTGSILLTTVDEGNLRTVMENGDWVTTEVEYPTEGGTYYGKVIVPAVTAYTDLS